MAKDISSSFESYFNDLPDPRIDRKKLYPLTEILFVTLCGSICGAESWRDYTLFGQEKLSFLKKHFEFKHGIPSKNTFARVFSALDPDAFKICFIEWVKSFQVLIEGVVAIDGKTLRASHDNKQGQSTIHMVSAFAEQTRLILGQQKVDKKSNEIIAIPKLLDLLDLKGAIVTLDAMGCQKGIAKKIVAKGANYILALKGNQGNLNDDVRLFLDTEIEKGSGSALVGDHLEADKGHGRLETRRCFVSNQLDWLEQKPDWAGLQTLVVVEETREVKGKTSCERRYFISSLPPDAVKIGAAIRHHWSVESMHWSLDVVFNEDQSRVRKDNAPENMAIVRHTVMNMLNKAKDYYGIGLKALRKKAGWSEGTLHNIFMQSF
jgi:predicted transposase YbfD/YdcC